MTARMWNYRINYHKHIIFLMSMVLILFTASCSYQAEFTADDKTLEDSISDGISDIISNSDSKKDFSNGEVVRTENGYQIVGAFGETSERVEINNKYIIEGTFYE